jgi:proteic killer suppression protein
MICGDFLAGANLENGDSQDSEELRSLPAWKVHTLTGDRKGTWSLSVTRNRRLTFRIDIAEREIYDLNLEDYH